MGAEDTIPMIRIAIDAKAFEGIAAKSLGTTSRGRPQ
jgi:hypothetical protein